MKAVGYFETSGSDFRVMQRTYRHLIRVKPVLNGTSTERKPVFSLQGLQCRRSTQRNIVKPLLMNEKYVTREAN